MSYVNQEKCNCGCRAFYILCTVDHSKNDKMAHNFVFICRNCGEQLDTDDLFYNHLGESDAKKKAGK